MIYYFLLMIESQTELADGRLRGVRFFVASRLLLHDAVRPPAKVMQGQARRACYEVYLQTRFAPPLEGLFGMFAQLSCHRGISRFRAIVCDSDLQVVAYFVYRLRCLLRQSLDGCV